MASAIALLLSAALTTAGLGLGGNAWATETPDPEVAATSPSPTPSAAEETAGAEAGPTTGSSEPTPGASEPAEVTGPDGDAEPSTAPSVSPSASQETPAVAGTGFLEVTPSAAGTCSPADVYYTVGSAIWVYSAATKKSTQLKSYSSTVDALAVSSNGYAYFLFAGTSQPRIYRVDLATGAESTFTGSTPIASSSWWVAGAVNPQNGIYYYADSVGRIYAFDTNTDTPIGFVGQTSPAMPDDHGDLAFDSEGNLYLYWAGRAIMTAAAADVPVTAQSSGKTIAVVETGNATLSDSGAYVSGLAWMSAETERQLWSTDYTYQNRGIDAQTPGIRSSLKQDALTLPGPASGYIYDIASCPTAADPTPRLTLSKDVVGRADDTDQFTLTIERPAGGVEATATTSGTATGLQSTLAGPVSVEPGTTYLLRETGSGGTDLGRYTSTLECRDAKAGTVLPTQVSGSAHSLVYPASGVTNVSCTFTNLPPATITVTKKLPGGRFAASDQFTVELRDGGPTGEIVDTPGTETTAGQGTTVDAGTGSTGRAEVNAGTQYTITESGGPGVALEEYAATITCTDPTGRQAGLPNEAALDPATGYSLTPQSGAQISCTISNRASSGAGIGIGQGLTCEAGYIYAIAGTNPSSSDAGGYRVRSYSHVYKIDTATGAAVEYQAEVPTTWGNTTYSGRVNSLAISQGGLYSYYTTQRTVATDPRGLPVFRQDNETGQTERVSELGIPDDVVRNNVAGASSTVRGGINPADGIYWVSSTIGDNTHHLWAYNTLTGQNYGYVGYLTGSAQAGGPTGGNGDLVFDQDGNMLFVSSTETAGQLFRIEDLSAALVGAPRANATSIDGYVTKAKLADLSTSGQFNGVTFDNDGYLYVSYSSGDYSMIQKLDPNTGAAAGTPLRVTGLNQPTTTWTQRSVVDLADCNDPGGLRLRKDYPDGRVAPQDNVRLEIRKNGISGALVGGSATTAGPATGLQNASAGVIIGVPGGTYVLTETATSGQLADYATSLACVDKTHGDANVPVRKVSQGRYELDFPGVGPADGELLANVVCTYVNTPNGTLQLEKQLAGNRAAAADQFQVRILTGESTVDSATTTGTGAVVEGGVAGVVRAQTGDDGVLTYTFDELGWRDGAELAAVLESYPNPTLTCTDAAGKQPEADLPYDILLEDFEGISPVPGAEISCVITNSASKAWIAVEKLGSAQCLAPGAEPTPVTYTYQVTNIGQEPLGDVTLTDDKGDTTYVSGDTNSDGILTPDETWVYTMAADLTKPTSNVATATAVGVDSGDKTLARDTWSVGEPSALTATKTSSADGPVKAGDELTYTVTVTNDGDEDATGISLNDTLPAGVSYVPDSATKTYWTGAGDPGGTISGTWTTTLPDFSFVSTADGSFNVNAVQSFSTVGEVPADAQLTSYSITLKGSSPSHYINDVGVIGYLPGQSLGTANPGTAKGQGPTATQWFREGYQAFGTGQSYGTWKTVTNSGTVSGTASGVFRLQWWDYQNAASPAGADNTASGVTVTLNYTYAVPATQRVQVTDAAQDPADLVTAADDITLQPGESMTVTFKVRVDDPLDPAITELTNTATVTSEQDADCPATGTVTDPVEQPDTPGQPIGVEKLGLNCDVGQPVCALPGAEFALYDVDPLSDGAVPIEGGVTADPDDGSRFVSIDLPPGEYWLVETKSPEGFVLLATPIGFELTADGIVLDGPGGATVRLKDGNAFILQVTDATAAPLPEAGGGGPWPFLGVGAVLLLAALLLTKTPGSRRAPKAASR